MNVAGVWQRLWEQDPIGDEANADTGTFVLWTQSPNSGIYIDIRLPPGAPGRSKELAESYGYHPRPEALEGVGLPTSNNPEKQNNLFNIFTLQKSFAGVMEFTPGDTTSGEALNMDQELAKLSAAASSNSESLPLCTCFWRRDIDLQPPTGGLDVGVCASGPPNDDGSIDLRETGADGSYAELWHRLSKSNKGPYFAMELISENNMKRTGYWIRTGEYFAYAVGRPESPETALSLGCHEKCFELKRSCVGKSLHEAVVSLDSDKSKQMALLGSYVAVTGKLERQNESEESYNWKIKHSTDPELVNCLLVDSIPGEVCCSTVSLTDSEGKSKSAKLAEGDIVVQTLAGKRGKIRHWKVVEVVGACGFL